MGAVSFRDADGEFFEGKRVCSRSCGRFTSRPQPVRRGTDVANALPARGFGL